MTSGEGRGRLGVAECVPLFKTGVPGVELNMRNWLDHTSSVLLTFGRITVIVH